MENKETKKKRVWPWVVLGLVILGQLNKKSSKPYHADVYSSWEEEQLDEMRADLNYLEDKLAKRIR